MRGFSAGGFGGCGLFAALLLAVKPPSRLGDVANLGRTEDDVQHPHQESGKHNQAGDQDKLMRPHSDHVPLICLAVCKITIIIP